MEDTETDFLTTIKGIIDDFYAILDKDGRVKRETLAKAQEANSNLLKKVFEYLAKVERKKGISEGLEIALDKQLKTINDLHQENTRLKMELNNLKNNPPVSYAAAAASATSDPEAQLFTVSITSKEEKTPTEITDSLRAQKELKIQPIDVIKTKSSLLLKFPSKQEADDLKDKLLTVPEIAEKNEIKISKSRTFRLILLGLSKDSSAEELLDSLKEVPGLDPEEIKLIRTFQSRNEDQNIIIEVDQHNKNILKKRKRICFDLRSIRVEDYVTVLRCFKCQRLGHLAFRCSRQVACAKCSGEHDVKECTSEQQRCVNCTTNRGHRSDSNRCPAYMAVKREKIAGRLMRA